jgi:quinohemoprotein ethanol dehydrogenase
MRLPTSFARFATVTAGLSAGGLAIWLAAPALSGRSPIQAPLPQAGQGGAADWPMHNRDVRNGRYSPLDEVNASNVSRLALKWSVDTAGGDDIGQVTPLVVNGVMYFNAGSRLVAVNGATGETIWTVQVEPAFPGNGRGPVYGDGRIYAYGLDILYAVDARTGKLVASFGNKGRLQPAGDALRFKYPDRDSVGYRMASPPAYYNGTLYVGLAQSEGHIPGGLVAAIDGTTGAIKWVFNTVPQGPKDDGWEIAKDTWRGGARAGGGMWTAPAIDPDLGLLYVNAGNPSPDYEGTARKGANLFTNSIIALNLGTGKLAWYYQAIHHDLWDWDLVTGPVLFDVAIGGKTIKGVGSAGKNCLLYLWNRETGQPLNPIVETAVPTKTDVPGEEVWPTQPIPFTAKGVPMQPFCATYPIIMDPERAKRARQMYFPYSTRDLVIVSHGGSSFGSPAFSPRTGLLYLTGKNAAISITVKTVGDTLRPSAQAVGHSAVIAQRDNDTGVTPTETVTAYNPASGERVWQDEHPSRTNIGSAGNLVTAGDIVFQGSDRGDFYALDALSGKPLFKYTATLGIRASPLTYQVNGRQYVSVVASNTILTFGLP